MHLTQVRTTCVQTFNYANRNASKPVDYWALGASYGVATGTAVGAAYGLGKVVERLQARFPTVPGVPQPLSLKLLHRSLPWIAVASAGSANVLAMRYSDAINGVTVFDSLGDEHGISQRAGIQCLTQVTITRVVLPVPVLLLPPFLLDAARALPVLGATMARSRPAALLVELSVIAACLQCALPFAIAVFPQTGSVQAAALEEGLQRKVDRNGNPITTYYYNKGI